MKPTRKILLCFMKEHKTYVKILKNSNCVNIDKKHKLNSINLNEKN